jgi:NADPH2:quinone reductase
VPAEPGQLSDIEAASLPETFFTVWSNVFDRARLQPARRCSSTAASSGIGVTAIQMAKAGARRCSTTVGSAEKAAACRRARRRHAIDYKTQDFVAEVLRLTGGKGTDVVLDMVAGDYIGRDVSASPRRPHRHHRGAGRRRSRQIDAGLVLRRRLVDHRLDAAAASGALQGADRRGAAQDAWPWLESGVVKPVIHQVFPAAQAARRTRSWSRTSTSASWCCTW